MPNWLLQREDVSMGAKLIYAKLCQYAGKNGECFPKQSAIAKDLGISRRQVIRYVDELIENHLIVTVKVGFQGRNVYKFLWHEWMNIAPSKVTHMSQLEESKSDTYVTPKVTHMSPPILRESIKRINNINSAFQSIWSKYPRKIGKSKAFDKFKRSVKREADLVDVNKALDKYLAHLKKNTWKHPQDGKTWFGNWRDWLDYEEPVNPQTAGIEDPFSQALNICQRKLSGSVDKEKVREVLSMVHASQVGTVQAFLEKRGLGYLVEEVEDEAKENREKIKGLLNAK